MIKQVLEKFLRTGRPLSEVLNQRQEKAIRLHCGLDRITGHGKVLTYQEIGELMDLPPSRVEQIIEQGYCKLQFALIHPAEPLLSVRVRNLLSSLGIKQLEDLANFDKNDLKKLHSKAPQPLTELQYQLHRLGKNFQSPP